MKTTVWLCAKPRVYQSLKHHSCSLVLALTKAFSKHLDDFLCADGTMCILREKVCDGRSHCPDGSDEKFCRDNLGEPKRKRPAFVACTSAFSVDNARIKSVFLNIFFLNP